MSTRNQSYRKHWSELVKIYGSLCYYCCSPATTIDHIIPYSYNQDNRISNLVPACVKCNLTATNLIFPSLSEKSDYIMKHRKSKFTHTICIDCLLPYTYRIHSPSPFLCAECYDHTEGRESHLSHSRSWIDWITILIESGLYVDLHRVIGKQYRDVPRERKEKILYDMIDKFQHLDSIDLYLTNDTQSTTEQPCTSHSIYQ